MEEALKCAEKVIEKESADYEARLAEHLNILEQAISEDDRDQAILTASRIKGEAGISGLGLAVALMNSALST